MNNDQPKPNLTDEQVAEVERRLKDANPTFMTVDREKTGKQTERRELLREGQARIETGTSIESFYDEKTGLPK